MKIKDHIVIKQVLGHGFTIKCLHCGSDYSLIVPINVTELVSIGDAFAEKHNGCAKGNHEIS